MCFDLIDSDLRFLVIYRPPEQNVDLMKKICLYIESCCSDKTLLIIGDLNCPNIDWLNHSVKGDDSQVLFYNTVIDHGFSQFIDKPTRGENFLDILLCNDPQIISNIYINSPFANSDHASIHFIVNTMISVGRCVDIDCNDDIVVDNLSDSIANNKGISIAQHFARNVCNWAKAGADWGSLNKFFN